MGFFSVVNPILECSENCASAAVRQNLFPLIPGTNFGARAV